MTIQIMATVSGSKHPEPAHLLAEKTHALDGKWLNSKITHIDDYFVGLIKIELPKENLDKLIEEFNKIDFIKITDVTEVSTVVDELINLHLRIDAKDRAGIIHDITQVLKEHSIKIGHMECHRVSVTNIGGTVFRGEFDIRVPSEFSQNNLIESLEEISEDFLVRVNP